MGHPYDVALILNLYLSSNRSRRDKRERERERVCFVVDHHIIIHIIIHQTIWWCKVHYYHGKYVLCIQNETTTNMPSRPPPHIVSTTANTGYLKGCCLHTYFFWPPHTPTLKGWKFCLEVFVSYRIISRYELSYCSLSSSSSWENVPIY